MENSNKETGDANKGVDDFGKHIRVLKQKVDTYLSEDQASDVLIIKSHLICEYYINQILLVKEKCEPKEMRDLTFFQKLQKAFDLTASTEKLLYNKIKTLNDLRNKTGHELEYTLSESDVDKLGYFDGKEYIIKKYDFENIEKTLHYILMSIVVDLSFFLFKLIEIEKRKARGETPQNKS